MTTGEPLNKERRLRMLRSHPVRTGRCIVSCFLFFLFTGPFPSQASQAVDHNGFYAVTGPCNLEFPADHGPHPGYRTEWWYFTGNLQSESGRRFGFQLTFFRRQISAPGADKHWPEPSSAWRTNQVYLAHAALTDVSFSRFHHSERISRGALELAGARSNGSRTRIFLGDWSAELSGEEILLRVRTEDFSCSLSLTPRKPPVLHGEGGYSRKGPSPDQASCYASFTRLAASGTVALGKETHPVQGHAWMDHEFSSAPMDTNLAGWDWFSLQFENGTELMIYLMRLKSGEYLPVSSGTFVDVDGRAVPIEYVSINARVLDLWESPQSKARYPLRWRIEVSSPRMDILVTPNVENQEMLTPESTRVTYWEGSVSARASVDDGRIVEGMGYMELTGYAGFMGGHF